MRYSTNEDLALIDWEEAEAALEEWRRKKSKLSIVDFSSTEDDDEPSLTELERRADEAKRAYFDQMQ